MKLKKLFYTALLIFLMSLFSFSTFAHSGGTDSFGGHYNHATGSYHYHHGYPAHLHPNGECSYELKEKINNTVVNAVIIIGVIALAFFSIRFAINNHKDKKKKEEQERLEKLIYNEEKRIAIEKYEGKSIKEFVDIPAGSMIGDDGLPKNVGCLSKERYWGKDYTFYVAYNGSKYHSENCHYAKSCRPHNAYTIKRCSYLFPCYYCKPKLPELEWVDKCHKIQEIQKKFDINMPTNWLKDE